MSSWHFKCDYHKRKIQDPFRWFFFCRSPFPSSPKPLHQSEAWCTAIHMKKGLICKWIKSHFYIAHQASLWGRGLKKFGNGLFVIYCSFITQCYLVFVADSKMMCLCMGMNKAKMAKRILLNKWSIIVFNCRSFSSA